MFVQPPFNVKVEKGDEVFHPHTDRRLVLDVGGTWELRDLKGSSWDDVGELVASIYDEESLLTITGQGGGGESIAPFNIDVSKGEHGEYVAIANPGAFSAFATTPLGAVRELITVLEMVDEETSDL